MSWSLYRWTWQLESPVYVGMAPAGSLNRCRVYVPARALWGAVTAEIARATADGGFPDYEKVGDELRQKLRFTYLFPAERSGNEWYAWLPCYVEDKGLVWQREDAAHHELLDRQFRIRLLSTRPSTAIEPSSDTAAEGSLRETECMNNRWCDREGKPGGPVGLVGYVFLHADLEKSIRDRLEQLELIMVGGDTRYGLGRLRRAEEITPVGDVFGCKVHLAKDDPGVETERVLAHAQAGGAAASELLGNLELLRGWDYANEGHRHVEAPLWVPGSVARERKTWHIDESGRWCAS